MLARELLRVLAESPLPVETGDLAAICAAGRPNPLGNTWAELAIMERAGLVVRSHGPSPRTNQPRVAYWRRANP